MGGHKAGVLALASVGRVECEDAFLNTLLSHLEGVDIVQVTNWEEIKQLLASPQDLAPYQTIVHEHRAVALLAGVAVCDKDDVLVERGELFGKPKELCIDAAPVLHSRLTQTAFVGNNANKRYVINQKINRPHPAYRH